MMVMNKWSFIFLMLYSLAGWSQIRVESVSVHDTCGLKVGALVPEFVFQV